MTSSDQFLTITFYFLLPSECMPDFFLYNDMCHHSCPKNFYPDMRQCVPCHKNCLGCNGPKEDDCKACADTSKVLHNGLCLDECPKGTYKDEVNDECRGKDFWAVWVSKEDWEACPHKTCSRTAIVSNHRSQNVLNFPVQGNGFLNESSFLKYVIHKLWACESG